MISYSTKLQKKKIIEKKNITSHITYKMSFFIVSNKTVSNSLILAVNLNLIDTAVVCAFLIHLE